MYISPLQKYVNFLIIVSSIINDYNLLSERLYSNEQIADSLGQPLSSICARINELKKIDLVEDSGKRTKSKYGRDCVLWRRKK